MSHGFFHVWLIPYIFIKHCCFFSREILLGIIMASDILCFPVNMNFRTFLISLISIVKGFSVFYGIIISIYCFSVSMSSISLYYFSWVWWYHVWIVCKFSLFFLNWLLGFLFRAMYMLGWTYHRLFFMVRLFYPVYLLLLQIKHKFYQQISRVFGCFAIMAHPLLVLFLF